MNDSMNTDAEKHKNTEEKRMLYPKNESDFDRALFVNPPAEYRGVPFWSWNCAVTMDKIRQQVECFRQMGMGGAMVHPRTGLDTEYLSEEYMALVSGTEEELRTRGMSCWLYDEERFPSGCAGGIVTQDVRYRARYIVLTQTPRPHFLPDYAAFCEAAARGEKPAGYYLCSYDVELTKGRLTRYERRAQGGPWYAYVELFPESPWFNGASYVDVFNAEAVDRFLEVTHARYARALGEHVGKTVPAIFTDEPHMKGKHNLPTADSRMNTTLAYTDDMDSTFRAAYGVSLLDILPELVWELPDGYSVHRYHYHEHLSERFAAAYGDRIGAWCSRHGIAYTGHFLSERTLYSQTLALGETMRQYRAQQLPGIDILAGQLELTTAKQGESVRRQMGREGLVCELYGVLEWDVTFREHKLQGDWLAALGVTTRVHHLAYMSMGGEAKRDWPAAIGWQSPWWKQYGWLETYFARVNSLLTRGKAVTKVAVVHPIESFWLCFGPNDQTFTRREQMDEQFENLAQWLLYGGIDYDYISESMLPGLCEQGGAPLQVGQCAYDAVIVPPLLTMRESTVERLEAFRQAGGKLIFLDEAPMLMDGMPSERPAALAARSLRLPMERLQLLEALQEQRDLEIRNDQTGRLADNLFYQLRQDGDERTLFICHVRDEVPARPRTYRVKLRGQWQLTCMNAMDGSITELGGVQQDGFTTFLWPCDAQDSLLLRLAPGVCAAPKALPARKRVWMQLNEATAFDFDEPNALLLDRCEYALDGEGWQEADHILRADNILRVKAGLPIRNGDQVQPWMTPAEAAGHTAHLRYRFFSEVEMDDLLLAVEQPENAAIFLNGVPVESAPVGFYVDEDIKTLRLPRVQRGENILTMDVPLTRRTNLEWLYVLGCFGVKVAGQRVTLTEPPHVLALDDLTRQGMPFYTGNTTYRFDFTCAEAKERAFVHIPHTTAPVLSVRLDGQEIGNVAWQPNLVALPALSAGEHVLEVVAYGNRYNGFGTLHNANPNYKWYGPDAYRTTGDEWTDCYLIRPSGILSPIELMEECV